MSYLTGTPRGVRDDLNRYTVSSHYIFKNEPSLGAGIRIRVNTERMRITHGIPGGIISLDGSDSIERMGIYEINRPVETVHIRLKDFDGGNGAFGMQKKHALTHFETSIADVPMADINPDLLPVGVFGYKTQAAAPAALNVTVNTVTSDWVPKGSVYVSEDISIPQIVFVKQVMCYREGVAEAPPPAGNNYIYGLRLNKNDNLGTDVYQVLTLDGGTFAFTIPLHNWPLPLRALFQPSAAEVPFLQWFWDLGNAGADTVCGAAIIGSYLK
jgi:hypothetical protein